MFLQQGENPVLLILAQQTVIWVGFLEILFYFIIFGSNKIAETDLIVRYTLRITKYEISLVVNLCVLQVMLLILVLVRI